MLKTKSSFLSVPNKAFGALHNPQRPGFCTAQPACNDRQMFHAQSLLSPDEFPKYSCVLSFFCCVLRRGILHFTDLKVHVSMTLCQTSIQTQTSIPATFFPSLQSNYRIVERLVVQFMTGQETQGFPKPNTLVVRAGRSVFPEPHAFEREAPFSCSGC